jgi:hypothetical protein
VAGGTRSPTGLWTGPQLKCMAHRSLISACPPTVVLTTNLPTRSAVLDLRACCAASLPGPCTRFVGGRSYDRPGRLIVTGLLETSM